MGVGLIVHHRKPNYEKGAAIEARLSFDRSAHALDQACADGKAEAGPLTGLLGREERVEELLRSPLGNTVPVVGHLDHGQPLGGGDGADKG